MQAAEKNHPAIRWDFVGLFVLYISIFVGLAEMSQGSMMAFREFTASAISAMWGIFQVPVVCAGTSMSFAGFPMDIVLECTALHYMIIFVAGVLAFRSHTLSYRAAGIALGMLAIFLLNIARIGIIGFVGNYFRSIFDFIHDYLWQGTFALFVVLLWALWVNGKGVFKSRLSVRLMTVIVSASVSFWLVSLSLETYVELLAALANLLLPALSPIADVPQRIVANGRLMGYVVGSEVTYSDATLYFLNAALLLPIASLTFVRPEWKLFLKRLAAAALLLVVQHLLVIVMDWLMEVSRLHAVLIWLIIMTTFIAPMLIWLAVMNIFRTSPTGNDPGVGV